jgi:hypothetical protein
MDVDAADALLRLRCRLLALFRHGAMSDLSP